MAKRTEMKYTVAGELGKGGFGVVYLLNGSNGHKLALKTVDLRRVPEDFRERAKDEAKILGQLNHRHLVHHVNSYIKHPYLCIITEFCEGGDMDKFISHLGFTSGLPEKLIVVWLQQTASALNYMHTNNPVVLHRDLKPQNIYVTANGDLRLGDLGLARKMQGPEAMATTQVGTILYLSPEIISGQPYNSKSDIWSLGCVFYDITGKKGGDEMGAMFLLVQVMGGRKLPLPDRYSENLRNTISSMLTKDPRQRPSASAILSSQVIQDFHRNAQKPAELITDHAVRNGRHPPRLARDLSDLKNAWSAPLKTEDILVPANAEQLLANIDKENTVGTRPKPAVTLPQTMRALNLDPTQAVQGMSTNSMVLFGGMGGGGGGGGGGAGGAGGGGGAGGASGGDVGAVGGSDSDQDTFYDSQTQPELGEEHLLLQIQQFQRECTEGLGPDILEAAYGVIGNVRDQSALEKELKGLLGEDMYPRFGAKILQLRALEYGLHKTSRRYSRKESQQPQDSRCDVM